MEPTKSTDTISLYKKIVDNRLFTFTGALLSILLAAFLIYFIYLPLRPEPVGAEQAKERRAKLHQLMAMQHKVVSSYFWLEKDKGIILVPVNRAMDLVVEEYNDPTKRKLREDALIAQPGGSHDTVPAKPAANAAVPAPQPQPQEKEGATAPSNAPTKPATTQTEQKNQTAPQTTPPTSPSEKQPVTNQAPTAVKEPPAPQNK